jgi:low temperature requirement protein LtrA
MNGPLEQPPRAAFRRPSFGARVSEASRPSVLPAIVPGGERHATWLELFFDLCFAAAVAVLAAALYEERSLAGLARFVALFVPVWWAWNAFTWYATAFDTADTPFRLGLLTAMLGAIAVAAGLDGSLSMERPSDTFVVGYASLLAVLVALFVRVHRRFPAVCRSPGAMPSATP